MNYADIVNLVFSIIFGITGLFYLHFMIFGIVGIFGYKKYPKSNVEHKYGLIIPARNEENVVGNLIESIKKTNYPQDKLHIFVIAHNCTDKTAEICRALGATVYEYNNPNERTMGYAFRYLFEQIKKDYGISSFDGFFLFNADNIVSKNYFEKMNDAFEFYKGECVVTSFRNSKNFGSNLMSGLYGVYFLNNMRYEMCGRNILNCSTRVAGTGYVINSKLVENGWPYVTLTEDWEFSADQVINNTKIRYCNEAQFFDEQPTTFKVMWRQRVRWSRGHLLVCVTRFKDLIKSLFSHKKEHKNKVSIYDNLINILPFCLVLTTLGIVQFILLLFSPLFGLNLGNVLLSWLYSFGISALSSYVVTFLSAVLLFFVERKRIQGVSFLRKVALCLTWPLFLGIQFPIDVVALFNKNCGWKTIPHNDTTKFEDLNKETSTNVIEEKPTQTAQINNEQVNDDLVLQTENDTSNSISNLEKIS